MTIGRINGRRPFAALSTLVVLASALTVGLGVVPAAAVTTPTQAPTGPVASATLSSTSPTAVLDDPVHRHVFVADGVNAIQVFGYDAEPVTTITNVGAVNGMVLNAGTIYATNGTAALVERIDTTTLTRGTNLASDITRPRSPVVLGNDLWVAQWRLRRREFSGGLIRINLHDRHPDPVLARDPPPLLPDPRRGRRSSDGPSRR